MSSHHGIASHASISMPVASHDIYSFDLFSMYSCDVFSCHTLVSSRMLTVLKVFFRFKNIASSKYISDDLQQTTPYRQDYYLIIYYHVDRKASETSHFPVRGCLYKALNRANIQRSLFAKNISGVANVKSTFKWKPHESIYSRKTQKYMTKKEGGEFYEKALSNGNPTKASNLVVRHKNI